MARRRRIPEELGIFAVIVLVAAIFGLMSPTFRTFDNANLLLLNGAVIAFLAMGQAFVLLTGGIDLSTGSNVALTGMIAALTMRSGAPWWVAALAALAVGALVGTVNGALIHYLRLPPFIVTFAAFGVAASIPLILTGASSVNVADPMFAIIGRGSLFGVPMPVVLVVVFAIVLTVLAVVGGVSLFGGIGSLPGALLGAVLIGTVSNGMNVVGVQSYWQPLVIGLIILGGVIIDTYRRQSSLSDLLGRVLHRGGPTPPADPVATSDAPQPARAADGARTG
ncbi:ABC transporter permease [Cellulomonas iranensis]|uniref:Ribose/xylose/arabinose/galactoside ABC-type transport system permease subunit n=1 Tax=Cellulomonas iranensis TaxID=76862 RepID=A0ABU0GKT2_9CELL|nr:ABC transporter permease [Cellulomonas iranensis]MDQ0425544.1 ribose/xylose/arabinose/galactoside ABC-type transport system permease subunit [Cellulomonas iranensis]